MTTKLQKLRIADVLALGKSMITIEDLRPIFKCHSDHYIRNTYNALMKEHDGLPPFVPKPKGAKPVDFGKVDMPEMIRETTDDLYSQGLQVMNCRLVDGEVVYQIK